MPAVKSDTASQAMPGDVMDYRPLAPSVSNHFPTPFADLKDGTRLEVMPTQHGKGQVRLSMKNSSSREISYAVQWLLNDPKHPIALLQLIAPTLDPDYEQIPQVAVRVIDAHTIEILSDEEFHTAVNSLKSDILSKHSLTPQEFKRAFAADISTLFWPNG